MREGVESVGLGLMGMVVIVDLLEDQRSEILDVMLDVDGFENGLCQGCRYLPR